MQTLGQTTRRDSAADASLRQVQTPMGRWSYSVHGARRHPDDPDVLLLHGMFFDSSLWRYQLEALAQLGRVVALDMPGHGRSEVPPPFDLPGQADVLAAALPAMEIRRAVWVGWSWGGVVALHVALRHPGAVAGLAVLGAFAEAQTRYRKAKYRLLSAIGRRFGLSPRLARSQLAPLMFSARARRERPELVDELVRSATSLTRGVAARVAKAVVIDQPDILGRLGTLVVPTLVLCGTEDRSAPPALSAHIARAIPGAELELLAGAGHAIPCERPDEVNRLLVPFVAARMS
jgi:pimeloyl-ACP methyl ester carboxylesterase